MQLKKLSQFLPGFLRKPGKPKSKPVLTVTIPHPKPAPAPEPEPVKPTKSQKILDDVCAFLARYLHCSQDQRTVLALWILHTWCFSAARSSPYLAIQSSRKLSGKTLCLRLLSLLCSNPALTSGYTASAMVKRIHSHPKELPTFLLDESPATLGSRGRSKNPKLRAILVSGFQPGIGYSDRSGECTIYSPKAFASTGPLPEALADCSIPIVLHCLEGPDKSNFERFDLITAQEEAKPLIAALQKWSEKNLAALKSLPAYKRKDFPDRLTSRGQDIVEPLLQLADLVGGDYPAHARQALIAVFDDVGKEQREIAIQLLRDIRQIFQHHGWPDQLPTAVLLDELRTLSGRPWEIDGPITKHTLAKLLRPYEIRPRMLRSKLSKGTTSGARGYLQEQFVTAWKDLLDNAGKTPEPKESSLQPGTSNTRVAQPPSAVSSPLSAEQARNGDVSASSSSLANCGPQPSTSVGGERSELRREPARAGEKTVTAMSSPVSSQSPATPTPQSEIPNKDAACCNVAETRIDPRIKGILDDPRNFYRQYPERNKKNARDIVVNSHHWPQPADDKGRPNVLYPLENGIEIPYTIVNRNPADPESPGGYHNHTERWPVLLTDDEKAQLAVARFYEIYLAARAQREKNAPNVQPVLSTVSGA